MGFYSVSFAYDYSTITVGVEAASAAIAIALAEELVIREWGKGARSWSDVSVEEIG